MNPRYPTHPPVRTRPLGRPAGERGRRLLVTGLLVCVSLLMTAVISPTQRADADADRGPKQAGPPAVLPALTDWRPGPNDFELGVRSRILVAGGDSQAIAVARTLATDLRAAFGQSFPVVRRAPVPRPGDILLAIDRERTELGDEGYELIVASHVRITGASDTGTFYGTRTLLQLVGDDAAAPGGRAVDVPRYPERGIEICPCEVKLSLPWIERLIKDMAYLKLNYLLIPLKVHSDTHPEVNQWSYYTKGEARRIAALAERYHVTVVPEINAPGHMEPFLFDRPDLQLEDVNGVKSGSRLDITKPEAFEFYTDLLDEYVEIFGGPYWHLGADEYMLFSSYENYPQIGAYAREKFGPEAVPTDAFIDFVNRVNDYVRDQHGLRLRIWNDGVPRRNVLGDDRSPHPQLDDDIVIEHWKPSEVLPAEFVAAGHTVMNAAGALYHNRGTKTELSPRCANEATLMGCVPLLWASGWHPGDFEGQSLDPSTSGISGVHLSLWQGPDAAAETEKTAEQHIFMPLRFVAQRAWGVAEPFISYSDFADRATALGHAPGWANVDDQPLPSGTYTVRAAGGVHGTLHAKNAERGSELAIGDAAAQWQVRRTDDGYYRIESAETGLCADMELPDNLALLESAPHVGRAATQQPCLPRRNTDKWEITEGPGGYTVVNALSRMRADVLEDGTVVQRPPDRSATHSWRFDLEANATLDVATSDELLDPGTANEVTVTLTNHGDQPLRNVAVTLDAPDGWLVESGDDGSADRIGPGDSVTRRVAVTPPPDAPHSEDHLLSADATYDIGAKAQQVSGALYVRVNPFPCVPSGAGPVGTDDEFEGAALDGCRWTDVRDPDPDALAVGGGSLRVDTQGSDLVGGPPDLINNLLLQPAPAGDWTIEIKMDAPLAQAYQQAGLMVHGDDDNFVEFVLVAGNPAEEEPRLYLSLVSERDAYFGHGGAVNVFDPVGDGDDTWWLRLTKRGDTYTGQYSADGESWQSMPGEVANDALDQPKMGLFATFGPPITVGFDYFHHEAHN